MGTVSDAVERVKALVKVVMLGCYVVSTVLFGFAVGAALFPNGCGR